MTDDKAPQLLYVEDEPLVALANILVLEEAGFDVEHTTDGKAALVAFEADPKSFQVLVTDVQLPELLGWDVAQRARELNPALPVVYVSGDSAADWSAKGVPNSLMLQKPFANAQLVAAITTLLNEAASSPTEG